MATKSYKPSENYENKSV